MVVLDCGKKKKRSKRNLKTQCDCNKFLVILSYEAFKVHTSLNHVVLLMHVIKMLTPHLFTCYSKTKTKRWLNKLYIVKPF